MTAVVFSSGILKIPGLEKMLGVDVVHASKASKSSPTCVLGWGVRENTEKARTYAESKGLPFASLEDGFIRSVGLASQGYPTLSLVCDETGIHYDATRPSDLESLLNTDNMLADDVLEDAKRAIELMIRHGVSKYSDTLDFDPEQLREKSQASRHVLVLDQGCGEHSVIFGGASSFSFSEMLQAAILENPDAQVWIKSHPDSTDTGKRGYLSEIAEKNGIPVIGEHVSPFTVFPHFDRVYTVSSQMGFEALLAGKRVTCFGMPFYAGWGVTDDRIACDRRKKSRSVTEIFAAAYIMYSRYMNASTGELGTIFDVIEQMAVVRRRVRAVSGRVFALGIKRSRRNRLTPAMKTHSNELCFIQDFREAQRIGVDSKSLVVTWGYELYAIADILLQQGRCQHLVLHDGFMARLEAGNDADAVYSYALERGGVIKSNGSRAKTLMEELLADDGVYSEQLLVRARGLMESIVQLRITRDGVDRLGPVTRRIPSGKRVIAVLGEDCIDSIEAPSADLENSQKLLKEVRESNPDAYIIYRPYSDSISGGRFDGFTKGELGKLCDYIEYRAGVTHVIDIADEVHVISATSGFYALLRGKKVACHGLPFYAGLGLTEDLMPTYLKIRRSNTRTLEEVVAAALILHATYFDARTGLRCEPEDYLRWIAGRSDTYSFGAPPKRSFWGSLFSRPSAA
jgi:capsular polysaccharide export protein